MFGGALDWIGSVLGDIGGGIESAASSVGNAVGDAATSVGTGISDVASSIGSGIGDVASELGGMLGVSGGGAAEGAGVGTLAQDAGAVGDAAFGGATVQAPPTPGAGLSAAGSAAPSSVVGFSQADATIPTFDSTSQDYLVGGAEKAMDSSSPVSGVTAASTGGAAAAKAATPSLADIGSDIGKGNYGQAVSDVGSKLGANANWLLPAGAIGAEMMLGNAPAKGEAQVSQAAGQLGTAGQQLQSYLTTGTLPPGVQSSINSASEAAKAAVRQNYAKNGMSGSSAEMADLQHVDTVAGTQGTQIALQLLQQGVSETQMSAQLYGQLMQSAMSSDQSLVTALSALAGSAARPSVTLNTTG